MPVDAHGEIRPCLAGCHAPHFGIECVVTGGRYGSLSVAKSANELTRRVVSEWGVTWTERMRSVPQEAIRPLDSAAARWSLPPDDGSQTCRG